MKKKNIICESFKEYINEKSEYPEEFKGVEYDMDLKYSEIKINDYLSDGNSGKTWEISQIIDKDAKNLTLK
jgi:hypothetical protein